MTMTHMTTRRRALSRAPALAALAGAVSLLIALPAAAQFAGDDITRACKQDIQRFCPKAKPGSDQEIECLDQNFEKLGKACVTAIEGDPATANVGGDGAPPKDAPQASAPPRAPDRPAGGNVRDEPPRDQPAQGNARSYYDRQDPRAVPGSGDAGAPPRRMGPPERADDRDRAPPPAARRDDVYSPRERVADEPRRGPAPSMRDCRGDFANYCRGLTGRERGLCIRSNQDRFSPACQAALRERRGLHREYQQACRGDMRQLCRGVAKGIEKIDCLVRQERAVSPSCLAALDNLPMVERRRRLLSRQDGGRAPRR